MANVESVANEIIRQQGRLTTWKLQKLVFYANAIHLVRHGEPLFEDEVEAFKDGPVVRPLWERFQPRRWLNSPDHLIMGAPELSGVAADSVNEALALYGDHTPDWLRFQTHIERPWKDAWARDWPNKAITNDEIRAFYEPVFLDPEVEEALAKPLGEGLSAEQIRERLAVYLA